jgi:hypothetical protein
MFLSLNTRSTNNSFCTALCCVQETEVQACLAQHNNDNDTGAVTSGVVEDHTFRLYHASWQQWDGRGAGLADMYGKCAVQTS